MGRLKRIWFTWLIFFVTTTFWVNGNADIIVKTDSIQTVSKPTPDSSNIVRHPVNPMVLDTYMPDINIVDERYDLLPTCPKTPVCPNANKIIPPGATANCPDVCTVTHTHSGAGPTLTTIPAVCPPLYLSIATYNIQPEYVYYPQTLTEQPVLGWDRYHRLLTEGYTCEAAGNLSGTSDEYCSEPFSIGSLTDSLSGVSGIMVKVTGKSNYRMYCKGSCGHNSCRVYDIWAPHDQSYKYTYVSILCSLPPGVRTTGKETPASLVCARPQQQWERGQ